MQPNTTETQLYDDLENIARQIKDWGNNVTLDSNTKPPKLIISKGNITYTIEIPDVGREPHAYEALKQSLEKMKELSTSQQPITDTTTSNKADAQSTNPLFRELAQKAKKSQKKLSTSQQPITDTTELFTLPFSNYSRQFSYTMSLKNKDNTEIITLYSNKASESGYTPYFIFEQEIYGTASDGRLFKKNNDQTLDSFKESLKASSKDTSDTSTKNTEIIYNLPLEGGETLPLNIMKILEDNDFKSVFAKRSLGKEENSYKPALEELFKKATNSTPNIPFRLKTAIENLRKHIDSLKEPANRFQEFKQKYCISKSNINTKIETDDFSYNSKFLKYLQTDNPNQYINGGKIATYFGIPYNPTIILNFFHGLDTKQQENFIEQGELTNILSAEQKWHDYIAGTYKYNINNFKKTSEKTSETIEINYKNFKYIIDFDKNSNDYPKDLSKFLSDIETSSTRPESVSIYQHTQVKQYTQQISDTCMFSKISPTRFYYEFKDNNNSTNAERKYFVVDTSNTKDAEGKTILTKKAYAFKSSEGVTEKYLTKDNEIKIESFYFIYIKASQNSSLRFNTRDLSNFFDTPIINQEHAQELYDSLSEAQKETLEKIATAQLPTQQIPTQQTPTQQTPTQQTPTQEKQLNFFIELLTDLDAGDSMGTNFVQLPNNSSTFSGVISKKNLDAIKKYLSEPDTSTSERALQDLETWVPNYSICLERQAFVIPEILLKKDLEKNIKKSIENLYANFPFLKDDIYHIVNADNLYKKFQLIPSEEKKRRRENLEQKVKRAYDDNIKTLEKIISIEIDQNSTNTCGETGFDHKFFDNRELVKKKAERLLPEIKEQLADFEEYHIIALYNNMILRLNNTNELTNKQMMYCAFLKKKCALSKLKKPDLEEKIISEIIKLAENVTEKLRENNQVANSEQIKNLLKNLTNLQTDKKFEELLCFLRENIQAIETGVSSLPNKEEVNKNIKKIFQFTQLIAFMPLTTRKRLPEKEDMVTNIKTLQSPETAIVFEEALKRLQENNFELMGTSFEFLLEQELLADVVTEQIKARMKDRKTQFITILKAMKQNGITFDSLEEAIQKKHIEIRQNVVSTRGHTELSSDIRNPILIIPSPGNSNNTSQENSINETTSIIENSLKPTSVLTDRLDILLKSINEAQNPGVLLNDLLHNKKPSSDIK